MTAFSPNWIVGTRGPDGTINYGTAARLTEDDAAAIEGDLARQAAEHKRVADEMRNGIINLPNTAEKGTALRVAYTLYKFIFLAQEQARLHPEARARELERARALQLEYDILHQAHFLWSQKARIEDEAKQRGEQLTYDQVIAKYRAMSALEMSERLDEWYIGRPQADSRGGYAVLNYPSGLFPDVDGRTFWNAYHSLQGRLANEASPVG